MSQQSPDGGNPGTKPQLLPRVWSETTINSVFGFLALLASPVMPYFFFVEGEGDTAFQPWLLAGLYITSIVCFIVFASTFEFEWNGLQRFLAGGCFSYVAFVLLIIVGSLITGGMMALAESFMWWPVLALFGIPKIAPLVFLTWLGTEAMFGSEREERNESHE